MTIATEQTAASSSNKEPKDFSAFISYPREDNTLADQLKNALTELDPDRIAIFVDRAAIGAGKIIGEYIRQGIDKSKWFIGLGTDITRPHFAWCGVELGSFIENKNSKAVLPKCTITCLYVGEPPYLFADRNCTKMVSLMPEHVSDLGEPIVGVKKAPIYKMLCDFASDYRKHFGYVPDMEEPDEKSKDLTEAFRLMDEPWALKNAASITDAYVSTLRDRIRSTWYPQKRIEIRTPSSKAGEPIKSFWSTPSGSIPDDSDVIIDLPVFPVFKLGIPANVFSVQHNWSAFSEMISAACGGPHVPLMINQVVASVLPSKAEALNDCVFEAPNKTHYRVILTRHAEYGNGRRDFTINFIETLSVRPVGNKKTSTLVAGILLASRYRFLFLEGTSIYSLALLEQYDLKSLPAKIKDLLSEWKKINIEAAQNDLSDMDSLKNLMGRRAEVEQMFVDWWAWIRDFESTAAKLIEAPSEAAAKEFFRVYGIVHEATDQINQRFIKYCLEAYEKELSASSTSN